MLLIKVLELGLLFLGGDVVLLNIDVNLCMKVDFLYLELVVKLIMIVWLLVVLYIMMVFLLVFLYLILEFLNFVIWDIFVMFWLWNVDVKCIGFVDFVGFIVVNWGVDKVVEVVEVYVMVVIVGIKIVMF